MKTRREVLLENGYTEKLMFTFDEPKGEEGYSVVLEAEVVYEAVKKQPELLYISSDGEYWQPLTDAWEEFLDWNDEFDVSNISDWNEVRR